ncbi:hypothetical protein F4778DRAFT_1244 [Xylariomycetidae sp. FL2044]|nr:hypothetical protein F4778DRAFT_1244 [Xylariomycetidae sp. FL2044]
MADRKPSPWATGTSYASILKLPAPETRQDDLELPTASARSSPLTARKFASVSHGKVRTMKADGSPKAVIRATKSTSQPLKASASASKASATVLKGSATALKGSATAPAGGKAAESPKAAPVAHTSSSKQAEPSIQGPTNKKVWKSKRHQSKQPVASAQPPTNPEVSHLETLHIHEAQPSVERPTSQVASKLQSLHDNAPQASTEFSTEQAGSKVNDRREKPKSGPSSTKHLPRFPLTQHSAPHSSHGGSQHSSQSDPAKLAAQLFPGGRYNSHPSSVDSKQPRESHQPQKSTMGGILSAPGTTKPKDTKDTTPRLPESQQTQNNTMNRASDAPIEDAGKPGNMEATLHHPESHPAQKNTMAETIDAPAEDTGKSGSNNDTTQQVQLLLADVARKDKAIESARIRYAEKEVASKAHTEAKAKEMEGLKQERDRYKGLYNDLRRQFAANQQQLAANATGFAASATSLAENATTSAQAYQDLIEHAERLERELDELKSFVSMGAVPRGVASVSQPHSAHSNIINWLEETQPPSPSDLRHLKSSPMKMLSGGKSREELDNAVQTTGPSVLSHIESVHSTSRAGSMKPQKEAVVPQVPDASSLPHVQSPPSKKSSTSEKSQQKLKDRQASSLPVIPDVQAVATPSIAIPAKATSDSNKSSNKPEDQQLFPRQLFLTYKR